MGRSRCKGISDSDLIELAREAKKAGLSGQQFRDRVRQKGGYASDASVSQLIHHVRHSAETIVELGGPDHPAYDLAIDALQQLAFERVSRAGGLFSQFVTRDGTLRAKNATVGGLNLADDVVTEESDESAE